MRGLGGKVKRKKTEIKNEKRQKEIQKMPLKARVSLLQISIEDLMRIYNLTPKDYMKYTKVCAACSGKFDICPRCGERVSLGALTCFNCGRVLVKRHNFKNPMELFSKEK